MKSAGAKKESCTTIFRKGTRAEAETAQLRRKKKLLREDHEARKKEKITCSGGKRVHHRGVQNGVHHVGAGKKKCRLWERERHVHAKVGINVKLENRGGIHKTRERFTRAKKTSPGEKKSG